MQCVEFIALLQGRRIFRFSLRCPVGRLIIDSGLKKYETPNI